MSLKTLDYPYVIRQHVSAVLTVEAVKNSGLQIGDNVVFCGHLVYVDDLQPIGDPLAPTSYLLKAQSAL